MKKKILKIAFIFLVIIGITGCGSNNKLNKIAETFNNCETVKTYKQYGYDLVANSTKDTLTISSTMGENKTTVEFKLNGDILSNENLSTNDMIMALLVIDSVGQTMGYKDGELSKNMNAFSDEIKAYTLDKEGFEMVLGDNKNSIKIDLSKKIPLISMDNFYLKTDDLDIIKEIIADKETGNQNGKSGNIAYDISIGKENSTIQIGQDEKLSTSAYKSILTALKVMYGENVANNFQKLYPEFVDGKKTVGAYTIEKDYKIENQDESAFKNTEVVLVTINNKKIVK